MYTLLGTNVSLLKKHFRVDDFPFPEVGYVSFLEKKITACASPLYPHPQVGCGMGCEDSTHLGHPQMTVSKKG